MFQINLFSQTVYNLNALTGRGDLELIGDSYKLQKEAFEAFNAMKDAAAVEGVTIEIVSSYRSFEHQKRIWERKYKIFISKGLSPRLAIAKIIEYSTIPGTSRHHWGTDIDIVDGYRKIEGDVLVPEKFEAGGPFEDFKKWMDENSKKYGFHLVYTDDPKRRGFKYEPWHYSFAPISKPMLTAYRKINILQLLQQEEFYGSEHFTTGFIRDYIQNNILDINKELL